MRPEDVSGGREASRAERADPGRFEYVHTPKHSSWLNLVESAFSKMARSFLRHIRVGSLDELKRRSLKGIEEINAHPVRFQGNAHPVIPHPGGRLDFAM